MEELHIELVVLHNQDSFGHPPVLWLPPADFLRRHAHVSLKQMRRRIVATQSRFLTERQMKPDEKALPRRAGSRGNAGDSSPFLHRRRTGTAQWAPWRDRTDARSAA